VTLAAEQKDRSTRLFVEHVDDLVVSTPIARTASRIHQSVNERPNGNTSAVSIAISEYFALFSRKAGLKRKKGPGVDLSRVAGLANAKADSYIGQHAF
jgi:hypothetical protein